MITECGFCENGKIQGYWCAHCLGTNDASSRSRTMFDHDGRSIILATYSDRVLPYRDGLVPTSWRVHVGLVLLNG